MHLHFICRGNTFRSRLAEALINAHQHPDIHATSSGIEASKNLNGTICWYTKKILEREGLENFTASTWTQTTSSTFATADRIFFLHPDILEEYQKSELQLNQPFISWKIEDIELPFTADKKAILEEASDRFQRIKENTQKLFNDLVGQ